MKIELRGETLELDGQRALYWPRTRSLVVADVHLGKGAALRRGGVAVPSGSTRSDLLRLAALVQQYSAERLLVLGDLFHAPLSVEQPWFDDVDRFRRQHRALAWVVVRGNHDRVQGVPASWGLQWHESERIESPFVFMHQAVASAQGYAFGGHVHPVVRLRSARDRVRVPVFVLGKDSGCLPSFGAFTGGFEIRPQRSDQVIAVTPEKLIRLSTGLGDCRGPSPGLVSPS